MTTWRERGYVPDSDDEDEDEDSDVRQDRSHADILRPKASPAHTECPTQQATRAEFETLPDVDDGIPEQNENGYSGPVDTANPGSEEEKEATLAPPTNIEIHLPSSSGSHVFPTSTAAKLEAEIQTGLKTVRDVLGSLRPDLDNDNDSPLSSAPSSLLSTPQQSPSRKTAQDLSGSPFSHVSHEENRLFPAAAQLAQDPPVQNLLRGSQSPSGRDMAEPQAPLSDTLPVSGANESLRRRSFRPRAPIQLHPYALEDARYRQTWTARGLKPVRAPEIVANPNKTANEDSQDTCPYESSQMDPSEFPDRHSSPAFEIFIERRQDAVADEESQSPRRGKRPRPASPLSDLEDLPDLSELLENQKAASGVTKPKKAKRGLWPESRTNTDGFKIYDLPDDEPVVHQRSRKAHTSSIVPPSPPKSGGGLSSQDGVPTEVSDANTGRITPALLPTPLVSSDRHVSKRTFNELLGVSDSDNDAIDIGEDSATSSSSEESAQDESQGVRNMRRKMKGVLPASWLKLDMAGQHKPSRASRHQIQSPPKNVLEKGVAKRVPSSRLTAKDSNIRRTPEDDVADWDSSSNDGSELRAVDDNDGIEYDVPDILEDDIMEDNTVDAMLAPRIGESAGRKRQNHLSIVGSMQKEKGSRNSIHERSSSHRGNNIAVGAKSKIAIRPRKQVKRKHKQPQMTLLDAPGFQEKDVPRFLRIASRRLKNIGSAQKQDPSKKFFRLATIRDTDDVNEGLRPWRGRQTQAYPAVNYDGKHASRTTGPLRPQPSSFDTSAHDKPLTSAHDGRSRDENSHSSNTELTSLKTYTKATLERIRNNYHRPRSLQGESIASIAGSSAAVLDFFKPQRFRRARFDGNQQNHPNRQIKPAQMLPLISPTVNAIEKLVPKPASSRQERRRERQPLISDTLPSGPGLALSVPSRRVPPGATLHQFTTNLASRKREPRALSSRNDGVMDFRDIMHVDQPSPAQLEGDNASPIILSMAQYLPGPGSFLNTSRGPDSTLVRSSLICATLTSMAHPDTLFEPRWQDSSITTPKSERTIVGTGWSTEIEAALKDSFREILEVVSVDPMILALPEANYNGLLSRAASCVKDIANYVNVSLDFSDAEELETFVELTHNSIEKIWKKIADWDNALSEVLTEPTMKILNGLLLLAYQIDRCLTIVSQNSTQKNQSEISKTRNNLALFTWELALRTSHIDRLFACVAARPGTVPMNSTQCPPYAPEVETLLIIHSLGPHNGWSFYMQNIVPNRATHGEKNGLHLQYRAESLAYTVLILACVLRVTVSAPVPLGPPKQGFQVAFAGETYENAELKTLDSSASSGLPLFYDVQAPGSLCRILLRELPNRVSDFIYGFKNSIWMVMSTKSDHYKRWKPFGLAILQWCFFFAQVFPEDLGDQLLKMLFSRYLENGMLELFGGTTALVLSPFLKNRLGPREIVPEPTDTDFDIFLKITAVMLATPMPFNQEAPDDAKKVASRRRSLVFLLLPNEGRASTDVVIPSCEEDRNLNIVDLAQIRNRYSLFATVYGYAPVGFKQDLQNIQDFVDFPSAHGKVREVVLACWASCFRSAITPPCVTADIYQLGKWIQSMFKSMCDKLAAIPGEKSRGWGEIAEAERYVHQINRNTVIACLCDIVENYIAAINLCVDSEQVRYVLSREDVDRLLRHCYTDQGLDDVVVSQIIDLATAYMHKGLDRRTDNFQSFRATLRGVSENHLDNTDEKSPRLLTALTEAWYALVSIMVEEKLTNWEYIVDTLSHDGGLLSQKARQYQILRMSKLAEKRDLVVGEPYPFIRILLRSIVKPNSEVKTSFVHRLLSQLMKTAPELYGLGDLRRRMSDGTRLTEALFPNEFDIANHRLTIVNHFIRVAQAVEAGPGEFSQGNITPSQWKQMMHKIPENLQRTSVEVSEEASAEWAVLMQKLLFQISLYLGPSHELELPFFQSHQDTIEPHLFKLEQIFVRFSNAATPKTWDNAEKVETFRRVCEVGCIKDRVKTLVPRLVNIFGAADPSYVDDDGSLLLDVSEQSNFMKAIFPAFIEVALDKSKPAMLFAVPVVETAADLLRNVEARVDAGDQLAMEAFAEVVVAFMRAAVKAMQASMPSQQCDWQMETACRLANICTLGAGRWAYLHQSHPSSAVILASQEVVQSYVVYAYEYARLVAGVDVVVDSNWEKDFGLQIPELVLPEHVVALKNAAVDDLNVSGREWSQVFAAPDAALWHLEKGARVLAACSGPVWSEPMWWSAVVEGLEEVLILLGLREEQL